MTVIDKTNIESASYNNIFAVVDNRSYIVDPRRKDMTSATTQKRTFVYDSDPFIKAILFKDMPYIVLELPMLEYEHWSTDGKYKDINWRQKIVIRTAREGASNVGTDTGRTDMFEICDDLQETFNKDSIKNTLGGSNIRKLNLSKVNTFTDVIDGREVYESEYTLEYYTRLQVST